MTKTKEPKVKDTDRSDYTSIVFHPDLEKFKMEKLDKDMVSLLTKRAYDIAGCVKGVAVYLNGKKLPVRINQFIKIYLCIVYSFILAKFLLKTTWLCAGLTRIFDT